MTWTSLLDVAGAVSLLLGSFLCLAGAVGLIRFPDTLSRLHAATKPQTLGLILILTGLALTLRTWAAVTTLVLLAATQFFTSPGVGAPRRPGGLPQPARRHRRPSRSTSCPTPSTARARTERTDATAATRHTPQRV